VAEWATRLASWRRERGILRFVAEQFHVELDPWQEQALLLFESPKPEDRRISLQACAGPGKSAVLAWCGLWFMGTQGRVGNHPKGLATSITGENLRDNLWAEFAKWMAISPYLSNTFTWTASRIFANDHPETWFIGARTWPRTASTEEQGKTFSGLHSDYPLILIDEGGGIPTAVGRAGEQAMSRCLFGKELLAGNPISLEGLLHAAANQLRHLWRVIKITGDPEDPEAWVHSPRVGAGPLAWAKEQIATYGRDNPWVMSYILGKFPPVSINSLLGIEDVEAAMNRTVRPEVYQWAQKRLGIDVARFGDDRTVIFPRQGGAAFKPVVMRNARTTDIAARVANAKIRWQSEMELVDDTGHWGHGVIDNLIAAGYGPVAVVFHEKAIDPRFKNRRAEMWMKMAEWVKGGGMLPRIPELIPELTIPTYTFNHGQFQLEEKDQIKLRLGRSPDLADALGLTFALPDMPSDLRATLKSGGGGKMLHDFDPWT